MSRDIDLWNRTENHKTKGCDVKQWGEMKIERFLSLRKDDKETRMQ